MTDLAAWLLEQITVDERAAREAMPQAGSGGWTAESYRVHKYQVVSRVIHGPAIIAQSLSPDHARHIARWDSTSVLADCDSKRRMVGTNPARDSTRSASIGDASSAGRYAPAR